MLSRNSKFVVFSTFAKETENELCGLLFDEHFNGEEDALAFYVDLNCFTKFSATEYAAPFASSTGEAVAAIPGLGEISIATLGLATGVLLEPDRCVGAVYLQSTYRAYCESIL